MGWKRPQTCPSHETPAPPFFQPGREQLCWWGSASPQQTRKRKTPPALSSAASRTRAGIRDRSETQQDAPPAPPLPPSLGSAVGSPSRRSLETEGPPRVLCRQRAGSHPYHNGEFCSWLVLKRTLLLALTPTQNKPLVPLRTASPRSPRERFLVGGWRICPRKAGPDARLGLNPWLRWAEVKNKTQPREPSGAAPASTLPGRVQLSQLGSWKCSDLGGTHGHQVLTKPLLPSWALLAPLLSAGDAPRQPDLSSPSAHPPATPPMAGSWEAGHDVSRRPASSGCHPAPSLRPCWSHSSPPPPGDQPLRPGKQARKVKPNHEDTWGLD